MKTIKLSTLFFLGLCVSTVELTIAGGPQLKSASVYSSKKINLVNPQALNTIKRIRSQKKPSKNPPQGPRVREISQGQKLKPNRNKLVVTPKLKRPVLFTDGTSKAEKLHAGIPGQVDLKSHNKAKIPGSNVPNSGKRIATLANPRQRLQDTMVQRGLGHSSKFNPSGFDPATKTVRGLKNPRSAIAWGLSPGTGQPRALRMLTSNRGNSKSDRAQFAALSNPKNGWTMNSVSSPVGWWIKSVNNYIKNGFDGRKDSALVQTARAVTGWAGIGAGTSFVNAVNDLSNPKCLGPLAGASGCNVTKRSGNSPNPKSAAQSKPTTRDTDGDGVADQSYYEPKDSDDSDDDNGGASARNNGNRKTEEQSQPRNCAAGWTDAGVCHSPEQVEAGFKTFEQRKRFGTFVPRHFEWQTMPNPEGNNRAHRNVTKADIETAKQAQRNKVINPNPLGDPNRYLSDEEIEDRYYRKQAHNTDPSPEN